MTHNGFAGAAQVIAAATSWAADTPAAVAVSASDGMFTFAEMMNGTTALAGALAAEGVGPGVSVGLRPHLVWVCCE